MFPAIQGKKTYILGALGIVTAVVTWLVGDMDTGAMLQAILTAALGMSVRHGIATQRAPL